MKGQDLEEYTGWLPHLSYNLGEIFLTEIKYKDIPNMEGSTSVVGVFRNDRQSFAVLVQQKPKEKILKQTEYPDLESKEIKGRKIRSGFDPQVEFFNERFQGETWTFEDEDGRLVSLASEKGGSFPENYFGDVTDAGDTLSFSQSFFYLSPGLVPEAPEDWQIVAISANKSTEKEEVLSTSLVDSEMNEMSYALMYSRGGDVLDLMSYSVPQSLLEAIGEKGKGREIEHSTGEGSYKVIVLEGERRAAVVNSECEEEGIKDKLQVLFEQAKDKLAGS